MEELKLYEYDYDKPELTEAFLAHHQIEGGKWGVMHGPPYPLDSSQSTGDKLKEGAKPKSRHQLRVEARKKKKLDKQRAKTLQRAREMKTQKTALKKSILEGNDIKKIYENRDLFNEKELSQFITKYETDKKLKSIMDEEKRDKQEKIYNKVAQIQRYADTGSKLVKNLASFYDTYTAVTDKMEGRERAAREAQIKAYKKKVLADRDLQTAYEKRNLFSKDELGNLMDTVDTDKKLMERLKNWNPSETKVSAGKKKATKSAATPSKSVAEKQIEGYNKDKQKLDKKIEKKVKFKNKEDYLAARKAADERKNYAYYQYQTDKYNPVTMQDVIDYRRDEIQALLKKKR